GQHDVWAKRAHRAAVAHESDLPPRILAFFRPFDEPGDVRHSPTIQRITIVLETESNRETVRGSKDSSQLSRQPAGLLAVKAVVSVAVSIAGSPTTDLTIVSVGKLWRKIHKICRRDDWLPFCRDRKIDHVIRQLAGVRRTVDVEA